MVCFGECPNMPCFLNDAADIALLARPVCVYDGFVGGQHERAVPRDPEALPRMPVLPRVLILTTIVMLFEHLVEGVVDVPAFAISAAQLCASGAPRSSTRRAAGPNRASRGGGTCCSPLRPQQQRPHRRPSSGLAVGSHTENIVSVDLAVKVALFLFVTSCPSSPSTAPPSGGATHVV